jgi:hypothetical protein
VGWAALVAPVSRYLVPRIARVGDHPTLRLSHMGGPMRIRAGILACALCGVAVALAACGSSTTVTAPGRTTITTTTVTVPAAPTAGIRIGDHPAAVRVVVDLTGPRLTMGQVVPQSGDIFSDGTTSFLLGSSVVGAQSGSANGSGVHVVVSHGSRGVTVQISATKSRFKYTQWSTVGSPTRVVFYLWRAAPPAPSATIVNDGCLRLSGVTATAGTVAASGTVERQIFENQFAVIVRDAHGAVLGRRSVTAPVNTDWRASVPYRVSTSQVGTLEAYDGGGTGNVVCLVQRAVHLTPIP